MTRAAGLIAANTARTTIVLKANSEGKAPNEIELLRTGMWDTPYHGMFMVTIDDLREYIQNIANDVRPSSSTEGLPIDYEHDSYSPDLGSAAWMKKFEIRPNADGGDSLWCVEVDWTPEGAQAVVDGKFKFFSPEFCPDYYEDPEEYGKFYTNVLLGGGLTNRPLFKGLKPLMAHDGTSENISGLTRSQGLGIIYVKAGENNKMLVLSEVRKIKASDLNDEQKSFLSDHKAELTDDERKEFGLEEATTPAAPADPVATPAPAAPVAASTQNQPGGISAADAEAIKAAGGVQALLASAQKGAEAHTELQTKKANDIADGHIKRGAVKGSSRDKVTKLLLASDSNGTRADLEALLTELPDNTNVTASEIGTGGAGGTAIEELSTKIKEYMTANEGKDYTTAQKFILANNKDLSDRVNAERAAR